MQEDSMATSDPERLISFRMSIRFCPGPKLLTVAITADFAAAKAREHNLHPTQPTTTPA